MEQIAARGVQLFVQLRVLLREGRVEGLKIGFVRFGRLFLGALSGLRFVLRVGSALLGHFVEAVYTGVVGQGLHRVCRVLPLLRRGDSVDYNFLYYFGLRLRLHCPRRGKFLPGTVFPQIIHL